MKRLCLYSLIASIISGCAATYNASQPTPASNEEPIPTLLGVSETADTLSPGTPVNITPDEVSSTPISPLYYWLQRANTQVAALTEFFAPNPITPDKAVDQADSLGDEEDEPAVDDPLTQIEIRILVDNADEAMEEIRNLGEVVHYKIVEPDINDNFLYNLLGLQNSLKMRERLLTLLARATDVQEALNVERQLSRLNGNIDSLKARLQLLSAEVPPAGANVPADSTSQTKPGLFRSILYYACQGLSWLFIKK